MELWTRYPAQSRRTVRALLRRGRSEVLFTDRDGGSRRIGTIAPKFLLYLIGQWTIPVHVRRVDHDSQAILQRGSLTFSDMLHIEEGLPDACLGAVNQFVCRRIDAAHTRDIKRARRLIERCQTPSTSWLDRARRRNWQHRRWVLR